MRLFTVLFCLVLVQNLTAQYDTEFGLDLTWSIVSLTGNKTDYSEVELFYKENTGEKDLRFRLGFRTSFSDAEFVKQTRTE